MALFNKTYNLLAAIISKSSGPKTLIAFLLALFLFSIFGFYFIPVIVQSTGGLMPIDTLFPLTAEVIYRDLANYSDETILLYWGFIILDCIYPFVFAGFFCLLWAYLLKKINNDKLLIAGASGLLLFPFLGASFDILENIGIAAIIYNYPEEIWGTAYFVEYMRLAKLSTQGFMVIITLVLVTIKLMTSIRKTTPLQLIK